MAVKKEAEVNKKDKKAVKAARYFYAVGRRKTSVAKIKLYPKKSGQGNLVVNGKKSEEYFPLERLEEAAKKPLAVAGEGLNFDVEARVLGGGTNAQADAIKLGIARALVLFDEELKKSLKDKKYLTRDPRKVERKKAGLKKARRAPQWAKR